MKFALEAQVGYYDDDDDTYHGPFVHGTVVNAPTTDEALALAMRFLEARKAELNESQTDGAVLYLHDEDGEIVYQHSIGFVVPVLRTQEPPALLIELRDNITRELLDHLKRHPEELEFLRPRQFERLIAEILSQFGWEIQLTPAVKDGGYDIFGVVKDISGVTSTWIIECKKYSLDRKVGVEIVRSLYGAAALSARNAGLMLATTSTFTRGAKKYASSMYNFDLRDRQNVLDWVGKYAPRDDGLYIPKTASSAVRYPRT